MRMLFKAIAGALLTVISIPLVLTIVYGFVTPPSLPMLRRHWAGEVVAQAWRPLDEIAPELVRAVIMSEDARFCLHWGIDLNQIRIVVADALEGEQTRGASTITMQVVKNLFLWPERDYLRKAIEVPLALWMDLVLPKDRILEIYLNTAQWGPRAYGIEAGARTGLGAGADALTNQQALALATMLPAPSVRRADAPSRRQRAAMARIARELERAPWVFTCLPKRVQP